MTIVSNEFFAEEKKNEINNGDSSLVVSYSQYLAWLTCPLRWKLNYVDGHDRFDESIDTVFGTAMHNTIQEWLLIHFEDSKKAKKVDLNPKLKENLIKEFQSTVRESDGKKIYVCDAQTMQEYYEDGCAILDHVQKYGTEFFPTKDYRLVGCEIKLTVPLDNGLRFRAYLDIVIHDKKLNKYYIIDLKTSRSGWHDYQKKDAKKIHQVLLYKKFYAKQYNLEPDQVSVKFIILKRKIKESKEFIIRRLSNFEPSQGKISLNKMDESWSNFLNECFDKSGNYKIDSIRATPSESSCKYCPFRNESGLCQVSYYSRRKIIDK